jgi:hypothetical protein
LADALVSPELLASNDFKLARITRHEPGDNQPTTRHPTTRHQRLMLNVWNGLTRAGFDGRCNDWHHAVRATLQAYPGSTYKFPSLVAVSPAGFAVKSMLFVPVVKFFEGFFAFIFGTIRDP